MNVGVSLPKASAYQEYLIPVGFPLFKGKCYSTTRANYLYYLINVLFHLVIKILAFDGRIANVNNVYIAWVKKAG